MTGRAAAWGWAALAVGLAAAGPVLRDTLVAYPRPDHRDEQLYVPHGGGLRAASLGFHAAAADWLWLRTVQYYGAHRRGEHDLRYFDSLVTAVTALDPRYVDAYYFASLVMSIDAAAHDRAIDVLKRGILANPDDWRLPFHVGFIHYVFLRDHAAASMWFDHAADCPGASDFCRRFAAFARRRGGDQAGSLALWEELRRTTDSDEMRALAETMIEKCRQDLAGPPAAEGA